MGTSNWQNLSYCVELIRQADPSSILDIGVGFGRWGMLCREFLDVWQGRVFREQWQTRIEGSKFFRKMWTTIIHTFTTIYILGMPTN